MAGANKKTYSHVDVDPLRQALQERWIEISYEPAELVSTETTPTPPLTFTGLDVWAGDDGTGNPQYPQYKQPISIKPQENIFVDPDAMHDYAYQEAQDACDALPGGCTQGNTTTGGFDGQAVYNAAAAEYRASQTVPQTFQEWMTDLIATLASQQFRSLIFTNDIPHPVNDFSTATDPALFTQGPSGIIVNEEFLLNTYRARTGLLQYELATIPNEISELQLLNFYRDNGTIRDDVEMTHYAKNLRAGSAAVKMENIIFPMNNTEALMGLNVDSADWPTENIVSPGFYGNPGSSTDPESFVNIFDIADLDLALVQTLILCSEAESSATDEFDLQVRLDNLNSKSIPVAVQTLDVVYTRWLYEYNESAQDVEKTLLGHEFDTVNVASLFLDGWVRYLQNGITDFLRDSDVNSHSLFLEGNCSNSQTGVALGACAEIADSSLEIAETQEGENEQLIDDKQAEFLIEATEFIESTATAGGGTGGGGF